MIHSDDFKAVAKEMHSAREKHPVFPSSVIGMSNKIAEEALEVITEANNIDEGTGSIELLKVELAQLAGLCFRTMDQIRELYDE